MKLLRTLCCALAAASLLMLGGCDPMVKPKAALQGETGGGVAALTAWACIARG